MSVEVKRNLALAQLFPTGFPRLWCPPLTHFRFASLSEPIRIHAHLKSIAPFVRGILVPGSTGEGWEMEDEELKELVATVLDMAEELGMHVLIGALKVSQSETMQCISRLSEF